MRGGAGRYNNSRPSFQRLCFYWKILEGNRSKNNLYLIGSSRVACCGGLCKAAFVLVQVTVWRLWLTVFADRKSKKNDDCNCISTASWDQLFVCLGYFRSTKWMRWSRVCRSVGHQAHPSTIKRQPHHWMPMDPVDPFVDNGTQGLKLRGHEGWKVLGPRLIYS